MALLKSCSQLSSIRLRASVKYRTKLQKLALLMVKNHVESTKMSMQSLGLSTL